MTIRDLLEELTAACAKVIVPGLQYSQSTYEEVLCNQVQPGMRWLDLGCGHNLLPPWSTREQELVDRAERVVGIDYDMPSLRTHRSIQLRLRGDITQLPFSDGAFDLATANMVIEHLADPVPHFREVSRILAPGGVYLVHTPNVVGYTTVLGNLAPEWLKAPAIYLLEGRKEEDVFKTYHRANSQKALTELAHAADFESVSVQLINSTPLFMVVPPLMLAELFWIRLLTTRKLASLRPDLIAVLKKPGRRASGGNGASSAR